MERFTVTAGDEPGIVVVAGSTSRHADMRTVWLEERAGRFVALDSEGTPLADPRNADVRVTVDWTGATAWIGMYAVRAMQFAGNDRDQALIQATIQLRDCPRRPAQTTAESHPR